MDMESVSRVFRDKAGFTAVFERLGIDPSAGVGLVRVDDKREAYLLVETGLWRVTETGRPKAGGGRHVFTFLDFKHMDHVSAAVTGYGRETLVKGGDEYGVLTGLDIEILESSPEKAAWGRIDGNSLTDAFGQGEKALAATVLDQAFGLLQGVVAHGVPFVLLTPGNLTDV